MAKAKDQIERTQFDPDAEQLARLRDLLAPRQGQGEDALICLTRLLAEYDALKAEAGRRFF